MNSKLALGIVVGLAVGVFANPLMPPAFFIVGGVILYFVMHRNPKKPS